LHFITGALGPERVFATGGLRFWKDGRDVPDVLIGLYDYPASSQHPAFNLILRVNFVSGAEESSGFRFIGSDGIMTVGNNVQVTNAPPQAEPGYTIGTFSKAEQAAFLEHYRQKYPQQKPSADSMRPDRDETFNPPPRYNDHLDHHLNFALAVRSRKPVVEDAIFGFRAAGPALLSNMSYFEKRIVEWDPAGMKLRA
jgi:hypothetical protein